ncbi:MAG: peptide chain release factor N(5)-glutamine methyltransferase [Deltaproteobacteria bacterium]|nr:peptide chain release factor N(5)-glutamine methyltransferase [Deltaproteobacteria bacterium]
MNWTTLKLIEWTTEHFQKHEILNPRLESEILLAHVLGKKRIDLYLEFDHPVGHRELSAYKLLIQRRVKHEPVQYLMGRQEFWSLDFKVGTGVLIPRPETECLVEQALKILKNKNSHPEGRKPEGYLHILELGTGSGVLAIVLAKELPQSHIWAVDISERALSYALENAKTHGVSSQIHFVKSDLFSALDPSQKFDLIISNPPYLAEEEWRNLAPHIREFEPSEALRGGAQGIDFHLKILDLAPQFLRSNGSVVLEIAPSQGVVLKEYLVGQKNISNFEIVQDYEHRQRVLVVHYG